MAQAKFFHECPASLSPVPASPLPTHRARLGSHQSDVTKRMGPPHRPASGKKDQRFNGKPALSCGGQFRTLMVELSGIEAQPASKASGKKRSAVQWKAGSKLRRAIPHVDGGAKRDCQRRRDSRPAWRSKSRPVVRGCADMQRGPIGPLCMLAAKLLPYYRRVISPVSGSTTSASGRTSASVGTGFRCRTDCVSR